MSKKSILDPKPQGQATGAASPGATERTPEAPSPVPEAPASTSPPQASTATASEGTAPQSVHLYDHPSRKCSEATLTSDPGCRDKGLIHAGGHAWGPWHVLTGDLPGQSRRCTRCGLVEIAQEGSGQPGVAQCLLSRGAVQAAGSREEKETATPAPVVPSSAVSQSEIRNPKSAILPEGWRQFNAEGLAEVCKRAGLPATGPRASLVKRLEVKFFGNSARQVNGRVKCRYCDAQARVVGTRKLTEDGSVIERHYSCRGRRTHTFRIQETVAIETPAEEDDAGGDPANMARFKKNEPYL